MPVMAAELFDFAAARRMLRWPAARGVNPRAADDA
jgi:hypothetical protein